MKISQSFFRSLGGIIAAKFLAFFKEHVDDFDEDSLKAFLERFDVDVDNFLSHEHYNIVCNEDDPTFQLHDSNC